MVFADDSDGVLRASGLRAVASTAYERWEQLEKTTGEKLLYITGGLYMGRRDSQVIAGSLGAAQRHQLPHELIEHGALKHRFPQFELLADHVGLFEPRAGFLVPRARHHHLCRRCSGQRRGNSRT